MSVCVCLHVRIRLCVCVGAWLPKKFCQVAKVFFSCYPSILTGKTPNMLIIFYTMRNVVFLVIKASL